MPTCSKCGDDKKPQGFAMHEANCKGGGVAVADRPEPFQPRSQRGRRMYAADVPTALDQIRINPHNSTSAEATGAWAYYIRPDGATIRDALILYPNGGIPEVDDPKKRAKFGTNASYYRDRQRSKGFEYLGPVLTEDGVRRLVDVVYRNREDEILFCEDEIVNCDYTIQSSDTPQVRDQARKRRGQFQRRLENLQQDLDAEAMAKELSEIARAQEMASLDPKLLRVLRQHMGELTANMQRAMEKFRTGKTREEGATVALRKPSDADTLVNAEGTPFIDRD